MEKKMWKMFLMTKMRGHMDRVNTKMNGFWGWSWCESRR
jgi:hypothetical protein